MTVMAALAVVDGLLARVAVTVTCALLAVRYGGGVYCPLVVIDPAFVFASPPETVQFTLAAPPEASVAVNCSTAVPEVLVVLQPVQLVSMVEVEGEMEKVPFDEVPVEATPPPQPAMTSKVGKQAIAKMRAGHLPGNDANRPPLDRLEQPR